MLESGARIWLLRHAQNIYRLRFSRTRIGRWLAQQILKRGIITRDDLQTAQRGEDRRVRPGARIEADYGVPGFHFSLPLNFQAASALAGRPHINVLLPSLRLKTLSGGPNTALLLAALLAEQGEFIRLIGWDEPEHGEAARVLTHIDKLLGRAAPRENFQVVNAFDRRQAVTIGVNDLFVATAWWSAQMAKYATAQTCCKTFIYLIQDFEPILHEGSTFQARALETYGLPHIPVINTRLLRDHLVSERAGLYADAEFAAQALFFEPAIDRDFYFPEPAAPGAKKTLLFYARPTIARRNLFEIGVVALRQAVASGVISAGEWDVWAMGEKLAPVALGNGVFLNPLPWMNFADYAKRVRRADLMLSLMLSPHPSYPPLEMAASGKMVVTNFFSVKTAARLKAISPNIIAAAPTAAAIAAALEMAAGRINAGLASYDPAGNVDFPQSFDASLRDVLPELLRRIADLRASQGEAVAGGGPAPPKPENAAHAREMKRKREPALAYPAWLERELQNRAEKYPARGHVRLSIITPVYQGSALHLLEALAAAIGGQSHPAAEWILIVNGPMKEVLLDAIKQKAAGAWKARVIIEPRQIGIVPALRLGLDAATGDYVIPVDGDDLITPDALQILAHEIDRLGRPGLIYSDEDMLVQGKPASPYLRGSFDPVLTLDNSVIWHLCAMRRDVALEAGVWSDAAANWCQDWDSVSRIHAAGARIAHVPEVLYHWRQHAGSTTNNETGDARSLDSVRFILERHINATKTPETFEVAEWPESRGAKELYIARKAKNLPQLIWIGDMGAEDIAADAVLLVTTSSTVVDAPGSFIEATRLLELHPHLGAVGGLVAGADGFVVDSCAALNANGVLESPWLGQAQNYGGIYALAQKPQTVSTTGAALGLFRISALQACGAWKLIHETPVEQLALQLCARLGENGWGVAFSPLVRGRTALPPNAAVTPPPGLAGGGNGLVRYGTERNFRL